MKKQLLPLFLLGTFIMMYVMKETGAVLKTPETPYGILCLEFAWNTEKTSHVINTWASINKADVITAAKINTYWDFLFIFFYAGFLFLACKKTAAKTSGNFSSAGNGLARGAVLAGILDIGENAGMLLTLNYQGSAAIAMSTTIIAMIKWGLALAAVVYVLAGLVYLAFNKRQ